MPSSSRLARTILTQMTFGYSRDDAERNFLVTYVEQGILPKNPFQTLDRDGVGRSDEDGDCLMDARHDLNSKWASAVNMAATHSIEW